MANIITAHYNGTEVFFQNDAFLNATAIAKHFNKLPNEWLRLDSTQEYIELLCKKLNTEKSRILKTTRGVNGGTWLHRRLAVAFARWLNVDFAIWCDEQIENILIGQNKPQQLALPEPEKVFNLQLTEDELKTLSWLWKAAVRMSGILGMLYPALIKLGSSFAPSVCGCSTEYERTFESARKILVRATQDIEIDKLNRNGWNNVLPELRRGEVNSLN
nr:KilA-N domain-containing protein [Pasteurella testudinis]